MQHLRTVIFDRSDEKEFQALETTVDGVTYEIPNIGLEHLHWETLVKFHGHMKRSTALIEHHAKAKAANDVEADEKFTIQHAQATIDAVACVFGDTVYDYPATVAFGAWQHIMNLCNDARQIEVADVMRVEFGGETYILNSLDLQHINREPSATLSGHEFILAWRIHEQSNALLRNGISHADDIVMTFPVHLCALLLRKEGEKLPTDPAMCDEFIRERSQLFKDMSAFGALFIRNFFLLHWIKSMSDTLTGVQQPAPKKSTTKQKRGMKVVRLRPTA